MSPPSKVEEPKAEEKPRSTAEADFTKYKVCYVMDPLFFFVDLIIDLLC